MMNGEPNPQIENEEEPATFFERLSEVVKENFESIDQALDDWLHMRPQGTWANIQVDYDFSSFPKLTENDIQEICSKLEILGRSEDEDETKLPPIRGISFDSTSFSLLFDLAPLEKEYSPESRTFLFSNKCAHCGATVTIEASMPVSKAGKVKKDKKTGHKYRDWDFGFVPCTCEEHGRPREVMVYYREWLEESAGK